MITSFKYIAKSKTTSIKEGQPSIKKESPLEPTLAEYWLNFSYERKLMIKIEEKLKEFFQFYKSFSKAVIPAILEESELTLIIGSTVWKLIDDEQLHDHDDLDLRVDNGKFINLREFFGSIKDKNLSLFIPRNGKSFTVTITFNGIIKTIDINNAIEQVPLQSYTHLGDSLMLNINDQQVFGLQELPEGYTLDTIRQLPFIPNKDCPDKAHVFARYVRELIKQESEHKETLVQNNLDTFYNLDINELLFHSESQLIRFIDNHLKNNEVNKFIEKYFDTLIINGLKKEHASKLSLSFNLYKSIKSNKSLFEEISTKSYAQQEKEEKIDSLSYWLNKLHKKIASYKKDIELLNSQIVNINSKTEIAKKALLLEIESLKEMLEEKEIEILKNKKKELYNKKTNIEKEKIKKELKKLNTALDKSNEEISILNKKLLEIEKENKFLKMKQENSVFQFRSAIQIPVFFLVCACSTNFLSLGVCIAILMYINQKYKSYHE